MNHRAPLTDDLVDRAVAALRETAADDRLPPALVARTAAAVDAAARSPRPWLGRPLAAIAAAAALATAAAVLIAVVSPSGSGSGSAFAAMLDRVREVKSVRYRLEEPDGQTRIVTQTADGGYRAERLDGTIVFIMRGDVGIRLDTASKTAWAYKPTEMSEHAPQVDFLRALRAVDQGERIEGRQVGRVAAVGYRVGNHGDGLGRSRREDSLFNGMRVYVDPATSLPVLAERDVSLVVDGERRDGTVAMADFEWNPPVDPALLAIDPPAGYHVIEQAWNFRATPQQQIAAGLRFYAGQMEGRLPDSIDDDGIERMHADLLEKLPEQDRRTLADPAAAACDKLAIVTKQVGPVLPLTTALVEVGEDKVHYLGKGLRAGDGSKIVAWWKAEKPGRAIAVYDDFSWKEIDEPAAAPAP